MSLAGFQEAFSRALFSAELDPALVSQIPHLAQSSRTLQQFAAYRERALRGVGQWKHLVKVVALPAVPREMFGELGRRIALHKGCDVLQMLAIDTFRRAEG